MIEHQVMFHWRYYQLKMESHWNSLSTCCTATRKLISLSSSMRSSLSSKRMKTSRYLMYGVVYGHNFIFLTVILTVWGPNDFMVCVLKVRSSELIEVSVSKFMTPSAFIFLYENNLFLTFRNRTVAVWNFRGELVTSFEDHLLWHHDCSTNNIYITSDQDLIISYCKSEAVAEDGTGAVLKPWPFPQYLVCTVYLDFPSGIFLFYILASSTSLRSQHAGWLQHWI